MLDKIKVVALLVFVYGVLVVWIGPMLIGLVSGRIKPDQYLDE